MIAAVNNLCAMRLVKEANPYAQYLNEYRQQITLRNACSYKPTFVYYVQIGEWKGIAALVFCLFITAICIVICWALARRCAIPIKS